MRFLSAYLLTLLVASPLLAQREFGFDNTKSSGQPYLSPQETVKRMKVAPEFEVKLFAGEPQLVNPIAFTIDEKGRIWVVECFEYPRRTPKGKAPRDRIVILEDTDGDGACDKRTVFAEGKDFPVSEERAKAGLGAFDLASGIEVGNGGVYVGAPPYLWFIENKNDKPGKFERVLSGFGSEDTHETLNTFQWGPDGWLYGLHGVFTQSTVKPLDGPETRMNAAVWRFHPKTKKFEIFAEGTSNPWGLDWRNTDGQFILACCVIPHLYHMVPGGIYKRQAGASFNPYSYGYINEICDHTFHRESGWAHAGLISLDVPHMPEKYRNSVIFGSIHGCSIKQNILKPNGSSFTASRGEDFLVSGDKNFRPINLKWGPNGDIYLIDWHDQNPCHQTKPDDWDYERGRVYRIQLKGTQPKKAIDLGAMNDERLPLDATDPYTRRTVLRLTFERFYDKPVPPINTPKLTTWTDFQMFHALGTIVPYQDGHTTADAHTAKAWQVRLTSQVTLTNKDFDRLVTLANDSPSREVRRELASAAIRLADKHRVGELVMALASHAEDANDPLIPHLLWVAWEKEMMKPKENGGFIGDLRPAILMDFVIREAPKNALVRDHLLGKMIRRIVAADATGGAKLATQIVAELKDTNSREKALDGLVIALAGQTVDVPDEWEALQQALAKEPRLVGLANKLAVNFRDPKAVVRAMDVLRDTTQTDEARSEAVRQLALLKPADMDRTFLSVLRQGFPLPVKVEAARGLGAVNKPQLPGELLRDWDKYPQPLRSELVGVLASRKEWSKDLLKALDAKTIDRTLVTDNTITRIQTFNDRELNQLIEKAWGRTRPTPKELDTLIAKMRGELAAGPASFARGKAVFEAQCAKCHKFDGHGSEVGPALDGAGRDIEYILGNVIDPNRVIGAPYFQRIAKTIDGRAEQGLLAAEDDTSLTLKVENGVLKKFLKKDLDGDVKVIEKSMMPEGLTAGMTTQDFRDLVRYVMANPFVTDVTVNGEKLTAPASGLIPLPMAKDGKPVVIEAIVTAPATMKTQLLVGATDPFDVTVGGFEIGNGKGTGQRPQPDREAFAVELPKGTHTLRITLKHRGATNGLYVRLLDPDRKLSYPDLGAKK